MSAKVLCNFRLFGNAFQGLLYSQDLDDNFYYWINHEGIIKTIDCLDKEPIDESTDRYEYKERFKLTATGFFGPVDDVDFSGTVDLYLIDESQSDADPYVNAVFENGSLSGFALIDHR